MSLKSDYIHSRSGRSDGDGNSWPLLLKLTHYPTFPTRNPPFTVNCRHRDDHVY